MSLQEHIIRTSHGSVSVAVYGDQDKPALITYPDLGLNCKFNGFCVLYIKPLTFLRVFLTIGLYVYLLIFFLFFISERCPKIISHAFKIRSTIFIKNAGSYTTAKIRFVSSLKYFLFLPVKICF
jgi:hypothetical protein